MIDSDLKYHYTNPKFAGLPWTIEEVRKPKKAKRQRHFRRRPRAKKWNNPHAQECRDRLPAFWKNFEALPTTSLRLDSLRRASRPPWKRVPDDLRKRLRRQFAAKYSFLLANIDDWCGVCGDGVWKEKHHIIPLSHGGINEDLNLIAICKKCHDEIHPWMKSEKQDWK